MILFFAINMVQGRRLFDFFDEDLRSVKSDFSDDGPLNELPFFGGSPMERIVYSKELCEEYYPFIEKYCNEQFSKGELDLTEWARYIEIKDSLKRMKYI